MYILFYAVNGLGLGHLTRLLAIARELRKKDPNLTPLFFVSSEAAQVVYQEGFACYKVPSKTSAQLVGLSRKKLTQSYLQILHALIGIYQPKAIVVDTFPLGALQELGGILGANLGMKKVFIHREQKNLTLQKIQIQNFYDLIIAPHRENTAQIPVPDSKKLCWAGEILIRNTAELLPREEARKIIGVLAQKKLLFVNLGGGGDKTTLENYEIIFEKILDFKKKNKNLIFDIFFPQAPLSMRGTTSLSMAAAALEAEGISIFQKEYYPIAELMLAFDGAISAAGYNTFHELLQAQVPTLFLPKARGYDDQMARAQKAATAGAAFFVLENELVTSKDWVEKLGAELFGTKKILDKNKMAELVALNGAQKAAHAILGLLN
ncbi:glycosyltransferase [Hugenholtzia roseola]|uniref:glycosyltransferase n=1 Tax=Hugenholtzia roseola TaxID=1002 RepID=UPI00047DE5AE|nr:glycosyltransferase [Hugenholtzia roseola]